MDKMHFVKTPIQGCKNEDHPHQIAFQTHTFHAKNISKENAYKMNLSYTRVMNLDTYPPPKNTP